MAITLPVYTRCARQNVGDPGGTAEFPAGGSGAIKVRVHGDASAEADSPGVARGLLVGCRVTADAAAGTVTLRVYSDDSKTDELYNAGLDCSASPFMSSDLLSQGIPFFSPPHFTIQCSVDPNDDVHVTFYIKSIAGNG